MKMIDKVAAAIAENSGFMLSYENYKTAAKAAIEAMREPTEEMIASEYVKKIKEYQRMIDAALEEK